jgi:hypothetical protein
MHLPRRVVFSPFNQTMEYVSRLSLQQRQDLVKSFSHYNARASPESVIWTTLLWRVNEAEALASQTQDDEVRFQLNLFRNTHMDFAEYALSTGHVTDVDLSKETPALANMSPYQWFYPWEARMRSEGTLPLEASSLYYVPFFQEGPRTEPILPFLETVARLMPLWHSDRGFEDFVIQNCRENDAYFKWIRLILDVGLTGTYRHARFRLSFSRCIEFQHYMRYHEHVLIWIKRHPSILKAVLREYVSFQLKLVPALSSVLSESFDRWDAVVSTDAADKVRQSIEQGEEWSHIENEASRAIATVPQRVFFLQPFPEALHRFVRLLRKACDSGEMEPVFAGRVESYIKQLVPGVSVDLLQFMLLGLSQECLDIWDDFFNRKGSMFNERLWIPRLQGLSIDDQIALRGVFTMLDQHYSIQVVDIQNASLVQAQIKALTRRYGSLGPMAGMFLASTRHSTVKTFVASGGHYESKGFSEVLYNYFDDAYVEQESKAKRQQGAHAHKDMCMFNAVGRLIQLRNYKMDDKWKAGRGRPQKPLVNVRLLFIAPCCGSFVEYDNRHFQGGIYKCGHCEQVNTPCCDVCEMHLDRTESMPVPVMDTQRWTPVDVVVCERCWKPWMNQVLDGSMSRDSFFKRLENASGKDKWTL